jgi:hypothetical protein
VTIQLPKDSTLKFSIAYDNGKEEIPLLKNPVSDTVINFKGKFYSDYAAILIRTSRGNENFQNSFFINQRESKIEILNKYGKGNPLDDYKLSNAIDFKESKLGMKILDSSAVSKFLKFDKDEKDLVKQMGDSLYFVELRNLMKEVNKIDAMV